MLRYSDIEIEIILSVHIDIWRNSNKQINSIAYRVVYKFVEYIHNYNKIAV